MRLPMRRWTLIAIVVIFALLVAATVAQIALVAGKPRNLPGPGFTPTPSFTFNT